MLYLLYLILGHLPLFGMVYQKSFAKPLAQEEESNLLKKAQEGDQKAREKLISHNLRLVAHIAKKYENQMDDLEDLISIGTIGLMKAIDTFHDDKKTKLGTYAARCITNEILMHLRTNKKRSLDVSLNEILASDQDGEQMTIEDTLASQAESFIDQITLKDDLIKLKSLLEILDQRERQIIELRYGLNNQDSLTQKEIAKKHHISRSYVSRIEKRALLKLYRAFLKTN